MPVRSRHTTTVAAACVKKFGLRHQFAAICRYKDCRAQKNNPDEKTACDNKVTAVLKNPGANRQE